MNKITHQKIRALLEKNGLKTGKFTIRGFSGDYEVTKYGNGSVRIEIHNKGNMQKLKNVLQKEGYKIENIRDYIIIVN